MRSRGLLLVLVAISGCLRLDACPSPAGGSCDPSGANCPKGYHCAVAEICTRTCTSASDCWVSVSDGCRPTALPFQRLPDGGTYVEEESPDGVCPETKSMLCLGGYCQLWQCADGGCDYDVYGPSPFGGNRSQGPPQ